MPQPFTPTHRITLPNRRRIEVMLVDGVAYTRVEWNTETAADYECVHGQWLFQGQPFAGTVRPIRRGRAARA